MMHLLILRVLPFLLIGHLVLVGLVAEDLLENLELSLLLMATFFFIF